MVKSSREGREELVMRVQSALNLATKREAESLVNVLVSCLEDTLIEHLGEDGFCLKLNGFGKFIGMRVKLLGSSRATTKVFFQLVAKNRSERHYIYEEFNWHRWRSELSGRLLSPGSQANEALLNQDVT